MSQVSENKLREKVLKDGYVVLPGLFTEQEIESLRKDVKEYFETAGRLANFGLTQPDAMSRIPSIRWLLYHEKLLAAFREVAGRDDIQFTFHSDAHSNLLGDWHTDTQAYFKPEEVRDDDFQVFKAGIYLQDHLGHNAQGLTVSEGSHLSAKVENERVKPLPSRAGDVIIFDVRLFHHGDRIRFFEKVCNRIIPSDAAKARLGILLRRLMGRKEKLSIFFTFGAPNEHTTEFSKRNMVRQNKQNRIDHSRPPGELVELLESSRIPYVSL